MGKRAKVIAIVNQKGGTVKTTTCENWGIGLTAETSSVGVSIFRHDPRGKVAEAYHSLTKEVLENAEKKRRHQIDQLR